MMTVDTRRNGPYLCVPSKPNSTHSTRVPCSDLLYDAGLLSIKSSDRVMPPLAQPRTMEIPTRQGKSFRQANFCFTWSEGGTGKNHRSSYTSIAPLADLPLPPYMQNMLKQAREWELGFTL